MPGDGAAGFGGDQEVVGNVGGNRETAGDIGGETVVGGAKCVVAGGGEGQPAEGGDTVVRRDGKEQGARAGTGGDGVGHQGIVRGDDAVAGILDVHSD